MKRFLLSVAAMLLVDASGVHAQQNSGTIENPVELADSIVVTANRTPTPIREIASSITVITHNEIAEAHVEMVSELLRIVPGIDVVQSGGVGGVTSVFIRGANSQHTLVFIDGIEMNDPSSPSGAFDFKNLRVDNIDRIEILRGPQSVLYGSDAIGGVIQIFTRRASGEPQVSAEVRGGSFGSRVETINLSGNQNRFSYAITLSRQDSDGISAASKILGNSERDSYGNSYLSMSLGARLNPSAQISFVARLTDAVSELDKQFGILGAPDFLDDPNATLDSKERQLSLRLNLGRSDSRMSHQFGFYFSDYERTDIDKLDPIRASDSTDATFEGSKVKFDWQGNFKVSQSNQLTIGVETEEEEFSADALFLSAFGPFSLQSPRVEARTTSAYALEQFSIGQRWYSTAGIRIDDHDQFGSIVTYRLTSALLFDSADVKVRASYGTGYKAPSLAQLFDLNFGNPNLVAEESNGWEIGIEKRFFKDRASVGLTYFDVSFDNLIVGDTNIAEAVTNGLELFTSARFNRSTMRLDYTYTRAREKPGDQRLIRRPENKVAVTVSHQFAAPLHVNVRFLYVGQREDFDFRPFPAERVSLDSYMVTNLAASYQFGGHVRLFGRIDNLFDAEYQEVFTYGVVPLSGHIGVRVSL